MRRGGVRQALRTGSSDGSLAAFARPMGTAASMTSRASMICEVGAGSCELDGLPSSDVARDGTRMSAESGS